MFDHDSSPILQKTQGWFDKTLFTHGKVDIPVADLKHVFDVLDDDDNGGKIQTTERVAGCYDASIKISFCSLLYTLGFLVTFPGTGMLGSGMQLDFF